MNQGENEEIMYCTRENCTLSILQPLKEVTAHAPCSMNSAIFYFHRLTVHLPQLFSLYSRRNSSILSDLEELYIPLLQDMVAYGTTIFVPLWKLQEIKKKKATQDFLFGLINSLGVHAFLFVCFWSKGNKLFQIFGPKYF